MRCSLYRPAAALLLSSVIPVLAVAAGPGGTLVVPRAAIDVPVLDASAGAAAETVAEAAAIERALHGARVPLREPAFVRALYRHRDHRPLWRDPAGVATLAAALAGGERDGLAPGELATVAGAPDPFDPASAMSPAVRDILLSDRLVALAERLRNARAEPRGLALPNGAPHPYRDPVAETIARLSARLDAGDVADAIDEARPDSTLYRALRGAMERELALREAGALPTVGDGPTIEVGERGPRVARLRRRLAATDELGEATPPLPAILSDTLEHHDAALVEAVRAFQRRHGLEPDGLVGRETLALLDLPIEARIERLRVNLERARRFERLLGERDRIVVNIPDFSLALHLDGEPVWRSDVIVGKPRRRTPVYIGRMTHLELDPTWTVPRRIVRDSVFARARADLDGLVADGFVLRDIAGREINPHEIDWERASPERFDYDVVQLPGPRNALGRVKFMFPNDYAVYLHDTPTQALFEESRRAFSHGCVRVHDPDRLAELVLDHVNGESRPHIDTLRARGDEVRVDLDTPLTVALLYWTADVDEEGRLRLIPDLYGRDAAIIETLDALEEGWSS